MGRFNSISLLTIVGYSQIFRINSVNLTLQCNLSKHPVTLIVSFSGFRYDYISETNTPNLIKLQEEGITVPYMVAQFPTNVFPNHHSIATGLHPEVHGVVDTEFFDPVRGECVNAKDDEPEYWNYHPDVLPFYVSCSKQGS